MWEGLKKKIGGLPETRELGKKLAGKEAVIAVCGLSGSARALLLSLDEVRGDDPLLVIAPDPLTVRDIENDLKNFGLEGVTTFPEDEILPYDYHDPDRDLTGMQMRGLECLAEGKCRVLICTLRSLLKKVFRPEYFRSLLLDLRRGGEIDPVSLSRRLSFLGYERRRIVEGKGQFAVRGGILDIFEVAEDNPVRLEFEGDEINSMRDFDVETQRSTSRRDTLRVRPFHHLTPGEEGLSRLRAYLEKGAEAYPEEERSRITLPALRLERGILFFGMEHYAAVVHEVVPVFEYFREKPLVVIYDQDNFQRGLEELREEISRRFQREREEDRLYPEPERVYVSGLELERWLSAVRQLHFRKLGLEGAVRFTSTAPGDYRRDMKGLIRDVKRDLENGLQVFLFCSRDIQRDRAEEILAEVSLQVDFPGGAISNGFRWPEAGVLFLSEEEIFGRYHKPWKSTRARGRSLSYDPSHLAPGDFVVHVDHGIGRYMGMRMLEVDGGKTECLDIRYLGDDRLFIPVSRLRMIEKYTAADGTDPPLGRLGSQAWNRSREKARKGAEKIARDLLEIYAARQVARGYACDRDSPWQREMEASFPWEETPHQLQATGEVKKDLELPRPMDRLLCGDVGFGKTEVAVRAAFKAVLSGKQAVFLVPTTVLALQHYHTLSDRLRGYPVNIAMLSRFISPARRKKTVREIEEGKVDIVIGTHRLLSADVSFKDLGLAVIDEEHRFGVRHKERFKNMKKSVDVLSMTATPIPRTLSMALSGIRDISIIDTPPRNRLPIHTEILPFDDDRIYEAIMREIDRGGQVFFVHNRVQSIAVMEGYLERLLPKRVRTAHAHGQMKEKELENIMIDFLEHKFDLLLCTLIIEAGLDFPNVNTIFINRADRFGLAQLYQLRGRVGRSDRKAYAYMLVPRGRALTAPAVKRLQAISEFDYLGAGYRIAMRDLEIRGAGNLLGVQQSGQIRAVGLDLYTRMVREEVARIKGETVPERREVKLTISLPAYLPRGYVPDAEERMDIYRRLNRVERAEEVELMKEELRDRFGVLPEAAENILLITRIKTRASLAGLESLEIDGKGSVRASFASAKVPSPELIAQIAVLFEGRLTFHTRNGFSLTIKPDDPVADKAGAPSSASRSGSGPPQDIERLLNLLEFCDK
ncbi:MAG: transcription-repair coupling factor [Candidatus Krumholzibacteriota bacterium]|nr:transcription-repair coupling factor [Candidatus Krumholzibacteriota bacterium]